MDTFIVSARKYRPQAFDTVVGQAHITTTLKNAIKSQQLAHAFLFCGPRGVGKTTCARILAKTINCENLQADGEACNECNSCKSFNEGTSFNIHELDAASNNSVDDIRALVEQVRFAPQAGRYKVYIVDEVHMLSSAAFNAFLKTLEEPPSYAIFILATTEKHKILPTILSRCQIFDFKRINSNDTVEHLQDIVNKEGIKAQKDALHIIAQKSEGCMRDALSIMDKIISFSGGELTYQNTLENLNILDHDYYFRLLEHLQQQDLASAMLLYDEINRKGFEGDLVLNGFAEFIRNILVCKDAKAAALLDVVEGMQEKYRSAAKAVSTSFLVSSLNILNEAEVNYKMARNKRLHVELTIIKLNFLQQAVDLVSTNGQVTQKKKLDGPVAIKTRLIPSIAAKPVQQQPPKPAEAKLYVQQTGLEAKPAAVAEPVVVAKPAVAAGVNNEPAVKAKPAVATLKNKKNLLDSIKTEQLTNVVELKEPKALNTAELLECWNSYLSKLEKQQKHTSANTFRLAQLEIVSDIKFTVTVEALTQQKFIEQEKTHLIDEIQTHFNNRNITYDIVLDQSERQQVEAPLTAKQKFELTASRYPLVAELKDKLRLEIDII